MRKWIAIVSAILIVATLALPCQAATTGSWDFEAGKHHAQDTAQDEIQKQEPVSFWAWLAQRRIFPQGWLLELG